MRTRSLVLAVTAALAFTTATTTASAAPADDVPIAEAGTIRASDLPSTFTETTGPSSRVGVDDTPDSDPMVRTARKIKQCKGFLEAFGGTPEGVTASAEGAQYDDDTGQASSSVLVFETEAQAQRLYAPLSKPSLASCLDQATKKSMQDSLAETGGSGLKFQKVTARITPHSVPPVGDETADYQVEVTIKASQKLGKNAKPETIRLEMFGDLQFVLVGRALAFYNFLGVGAPVDTVQRPAVAAATARLEQAVGG